MTITFSPAAHTAQNIISTSDTKGPVGQGPIEDAQKILSEINSLSTELNDLLVGLAANTLQTAELQEALKTAGLNYEASAATQKALKANNAENLSMLGSTVDSAKTLLATLLVTKIALSAHQSSGGDMQNLFAESQKKQNLIKEIDQAQNKLIALIAVGEAIIETHTPTVDSELENSWHPPVESTQHYIPSIPGHKLSGGQ